MIVMMKKLEILNKNFTLYFENCLDEDSVTMFEFALINYI